MWVIFALLDPDPESGSTDPIESGSGYGSGSATLTGSALPGKNVTFSPLCSGDGKESNLPGGDASAGVHHGGDGLLLPLDPLLAQQHPGAGPALLLLSHRYATVLRIRIFSIPDPHQQEFKYFNPKKVFIISRKYDPGCSSQIQIPDSDPGSGS